MSVRSQDALVIELPAEEVPVPLADVDVERVVTNLVDNAFLHGDPPVRVAVEVPANGWARVVVSDTGGGMSPELLGTATHRFARADEARSRPGSGLGLALVEASITRAGGVVRLCHGGHHTSHGHQVDVPCDHDRQMTVTLLLPLA